MVTAVLALAAGETLLAKGMKTAGRQDQGWVAQASAVARNGWILGGFALLTLHMTLYLIALRLADLSFVSPLTAMSYILGTLSARVFLHEDVGPARWLGTLLITVGVAVVAFGGGKR